MLNPDKVAQLAETRCRALSKSFLQNFTHPDSLYRPLIELVRKNKDLHLEFHGQLLDPDKPEISPKDEAIGIYHKGNSILGLHSNHMVRIHDAFTKGLNIPKYLRNPDDVQAYLSNVPELMYRVASHGKKSMEIEFEQMIIRANNREKRNNSEYIIIANQYDIGKRWDLLALKWPRRSRGGKNPVGQLVLIEVKYALNADIQDADQQLARYYDYIKRNLDPLCKEMELILTQKLALGLIERTPEQLAQLHKTKLSRDISKLEVILYLVDYNPNSVWKTKMVKKAMLLPFKSQIRIKIGGLAMWDKSSIPLEEATELLIE